MIKEVTVFEAIGLAYLQINSRHIVKGRFCHFQEEAITHDASAVDDDAGRHGIKLSDLCKELTHGLRVAYIHFQGLVLPLVSA